MADDGKCHICRRVPLEEDPRYSITTCLRCKDLDETEPGVVRAKRRAAKRAERDRETSFARAVVLSLLDTVASAYVMFLALMFAATLAEGEADWRNAIAVVALAWAAHAIIKPRPL